MKKKNLYPSLALPEGEGRYPTLTLPEGEGRPKWAYFITPPLEGMGEVIPLEGMGEVFPYFVRFRSKR